MLETQILGTLGIQFEYNRFWDNALLKQSI